VNERVRDNGLDVVGRDVLPAVHERPRPAGLEEALDAARRHPDLDPAVRAGRLAERDPVVAERPADKATSGIVSMPSP
jgi:hypothetical protein